MNEFKGKIGIILRSIQGELVKYAFNIGLLDSKNIGLNKDTYRKEKLVLSLTSYGRRVNTTLPAVLYSLLNQSYKPDVIVVWLDKSWETRKLPAALNKLIQLGVYVRYCEDIKSYKKLIPTLHEYPDYLIITVDDDVYYRSTVIERLVKHHKDNPGKIICNDAHYPTFVDSNKLSSYENWRHDIDNKDDDIVFPVGVGACLYKKEYLFNDVTDSELFMRLAPRADDIWFYFMALLQGTGHIVLPYKKNVLLPMDNFYQLTHSASNLSNSNYRENKNDIQIKAVMDHYGIKVVDGKFEMPDVKN